MRMNVGRRPISNWLGVPLILVPALALGASALAEETKIYKTVPSADEISQDVFGTAPARATQASPGDEIDGAPARVGVSRSIRLDPAADALPPEDTEVPAPVEPKRVAFLINFAFDSAALNDESRRFVTNFGKAMVEPANATKRIMIEGHADATGSDAYNYWLSKRRAEAVADALVSEFGIERDRLAVSGRGEDIPLQGRAPSHPENRRVEFRWLR